MVSFFVTAFVKHAWKIFAFSKIFFSSILQNSVALAYRDLTHLIIPTLPDILKSKR